VGSPDVDERMKRSGSKSSKTRDKPRIFVQGNEKAQLRHREQK
jgi:hypothetical protein